MRNEACRLARGDIVAHWDDDDWYGPERLTRQVAAIRAGEADITALRGSLMLDLAAWRFWRCGPDLHRRLFVRDVHGGTLVYRRRIWEEKAHFPDRSLAEDATFLDQAVRRGARLRAVEAEGIFVYLRHGANAWQFACGQTGDAAGWEPAPEPDLPPDARAFYAARSENAPQLSTAPLASCVMPTFDRRAFVPQAVRYFLRQDYPAKELIIVDDGPEPVSDLLPADPRIVYHRLESRTVLGAKRNLACDLARGPFIVHWDDDDWASPQRVSLQVAALTEGDADICGVASLLYYDPGPLLGVAVHLAPGQRRWAAGPSLCFYQGVVDPLPVPRRGGRRGHPLCLQSRRPPRRRRPGGRLHRRDHPRPEHRPQVRPGPALELPARPRGRKISSATTWRSTAASRRRCREPPLLRRTSPCQ